MPKPKTRGNGQGTAYQDKKSKKWVAEVVIGWKKRDDPARPSIAVKRTKWGFTTKKEALAYCPILLAGGIVTQSEAPRLSSYWEDYKAGKYKKLSDSKQTAYRIAWNRLKPLHDARIDTLTVGLLQSTIDSVCSTYYPARDCKSLLSNLFALAAVEGRVSKDLPSMIELPPLNEKERLPFTPEEQAALWKLYESGDKRAAIPLIMIYTGMMPGEAMALRIENIDLNQKIIVHSGLKTKVRKATPIVIADAILPILSALMNPYTTGKLWPRTEENWYADYYAALEAAGCRRLTPYSCRHTTATALAITEGIAPQTVRQIMRWSTSRMLDRYAHPETADALTAINAINSTRE